MEIPNYRPNSHKYNEEQKHESDRKVDKVISGRATTKKAPVSRKIAGSLISEDAENIKSYLLMDVLLPAFKDTVSDIVKSGIDMLLFGESRSSSNSSRRNGTNTRVSYNSYYANQKPKQQQTVRLRGYEFDDIVLDNRADAEEVLARLIGLTTEYGNASVADLYELVGLDSVYTDNKYGWYDLSGAGVERVRDGFMLRLPRTTLIE